MSNRPYACCVLALLCLGPIPALAQVNPWRVPQYQGGWTGPSYSSQGNSSGWSSNQQSNDSYPGGYSGNGYQGGGYTANSGSGNSYSSNGYAGNSYSGNGYAQGSGAYGGSGWSGSGTQGSQPRSWEARPEARTRSDAGYYASLQQPGRQPDSYGAQSSAPASGWRQNRNYGGPGSDYSGSYASNGYSVPATVPPPYLYGRQYGEFPPLEGEERKPSAERLQLPPPQPAAPPRPAALQAYGYGQGYGGSTYGGSSYGQNYANPGYGQGYGNGTYPDPALAGPSTLGNPWGGYASPFGTGVPGPYGW